MEKNAFSFNLTFAYILSVIIGRGQHHKLETFLVYMDNFICMYIKGISPWNGSPYSNDIWTLLEYGHMDIGHIKYGIRTLFES